LAPQPRKRGRKSRHELLTNPYTVYRVHTGGYYVRYTDPLTRRTVRRPLVRSGHKTAAKVAAEADRLAAEVYADALRTYSYAALGVRAVEAKSARSLFPMYLEHLANADMGNSTKKGFARSMTHVMKTRFGRVQDLTDVNGPLLEAIVKDLRSMKRRSKQTRGAELPFTPQMVRKGLETLSHFFTWAIRKQGLPMANPVKETAILSEHPRARRGEDHFYQPAEVVAFLRAADRMPITRRTLGNRELVYTLAYTGARIGEVLALRVRDVDFGRGRIRFATLKRTKEEKAAGLREYRYTPLWPRLSSVLKEYMVRHGLAADDLLFPAFQPAGRVSNRPKVRSAGPYEWLKSVCRKAKIPYRAGHHVWRHTYISARGRMVKSKRLGVHEVVIRIELADLQEEVGHTEGSLVTKRIYDKAGLEMPETEMVATLDWEHLAVLLQHEHAEREARVAVGYHHSDVSRMCAVASSPELLAAIPAPSRSAAEGSAARHARAGGARCS
jgi:integrase